MKLYQLAAELIKEKTDPETGRCKVSKSTLAKILCKRYPSEFRSSEQARASVRIATGSNGNHNRKHIKEWVPIGITLPPPEKNNYAKFILNAQRVGILSDIHFPYYDKKALNAAIHYLESWEPDCILLNGDIIDCYQLSNFDRDPRNRSFKYELDMLRSFITQLRDRWPNAKIIFKTGNHEARYEKRILQRVPEFVDLELFKFETIISAKEFGIDVVDNKRIIQLGKLNIIHGHELTRGIASPVNPARGFFLKTKANVLGGHHHQTSDHSESDLNGKIIGAWSTGCLCDLHPDYMPVNKWNQGFATVENYGTEFMVHNHRIIHGRVL